MIVWRLTTERHVTDAFDGEGARFHGGRFNRPGCPVVYCASVLSLAALEVLVHLDPAHAPVKWVAIPATVPDDLPSQCLAVADLPPAWRSYPAPEALGAAGTDWFKAAQTAVLCVPSAVIPGEHNYLLNPTHPDMARIEIGSGQPFGFDPRLWEVKGAESS